MIEKLVITRPDHELTTNYLSNWSQIIILEAKRRNVQVVDLKRERANRREFESVISKTQPIFIILNGHGNDTMVTGHENLPLVEAGVNEQSLKGTITYAISCRSAKRLGKKAVKTGARAYIGYDDNRAFQKYVSSKYPQAIDKRVPSTREGSPAIFGLGYELSSLPWRPSGENLMTILQAGHFLKARGNLILKKSSRISIILELDIDKNHQLLL